MPKVQVLVERCKGCERCNDACPQQIVKMSTDLNSKGYKYSTIVDQSRCLGCRLCAISCPDVALEVSIEGTQYEFFSY